MKKQKIVDILSYLRYSDYFPERTREIEAALIVIKQAASEAADEIEELRIENRILKQKLRKYL